jgi:hypothetical protein
MQQLVNDQEFTVDPTNRLRIATRIHFALLRHFDEDVAVSALLAGEADAREALWVCEASQSDELVALAAQFKAVNKQEARSARQRTSSVQPVSSITAPNPAGAAGATAQDLAWAQDSSGFGVSRLPSFMADPTPTITDWLKPSNWLRRTATSNAS